MHPLFGHIAITGASLLEAAPCPVTAGPASTSAALLAMVQSRATASRHGRHSFCLDSRSPELHNSHFITTFLISTANHLGADTCFAKALAVPIERLRQLGEQQEIAITHHRTRTYRMSLNRCHMSAGGQIYVTS